MGVARIGQRFRALITAQQEFTASWANLGPVIPVNQFNSLGLILGLEVNNSLDMRLRLIVRALGSESDPEVSFPILTPSATQVDVAPEFFQFADINQDIFLSFNLANVVDFVQFQIQVGTLGVTPANVQGAGYALGQA